MNQVVSGLNKSLNYLMANSFTGYDPYDGANTKIRFIKNSKFLRTASTYFNKFSPVNVRTVLKIEPTCQNQALGFIGRAMLVEERKYREEINSIATKLINESLIDKYSYHCWDSHGFPIQMRGSYRPVGMTDIIGNEAIGRFFLELYKLNTDSLSRDICLSVRDLFYKELKILYKGIHFYKYKPITPEYQWCYNASAIACAYVGAVSAFFQDDIDRAFEQNCMQDIINRQKKEGDWYYSNNLDTGYEKPQVDFHQGFILDGILEYMQLNGYNEPYASAYEKGLEFYYKKQFLPTGQGIYRYPRKWPVNIHNQAQGIITFSRAASAGFGENYLDFARTIAEWTINNMQDKDGHFYYLKYPFFTNKIPYIRWSDAAMAYALAVFLKVVSEKES